VSARSRGLRVLRLAALVAAGIVVALAAAELALRLFPPGAPKPVPLRQNDAANPAYANLPQLDTVADLAQPGVRGLHHGVLHRTNSRGVRGPEYSDEPAPGTFRIVVAGDSFTMGHRVEEEEAYPARLEALLDRAGDAQRVEVINLGLSGLDADWVLRRLERVGLLYHPKLVIYGFNVNDIQGGDYRTTTAAARAAFLDEIYRFQHSPLRLLRVLWPRLVLLASALDPAPGSQEFELDYNYFHNPPAWAQITRVFDRLAAIEREKELCVHVFVLPVFHQLRGVHPYRAIYERVGEAALARGLSVTQAFPALRGRDGDALRFGEGDLHPNVEGHRLLAEALFAGLRALPARCGLAPPGGS
jgi:lysophospholipase L1-like esterase